MSQDLEASGNALQPEQDGWSRLFLNVPPYFSRAITGDTGYMPHTGDVCRRALNQRGCQCGVAHMKGRARARRNIRGRQLPVLLEPSCKLQTSGDDPAAQY